MSPGHYAGIAPRLLKHIDEGDFVLGDRAFCSYQVLTAVRMLQSSSNGQDWADLVYLDGGPGLLGFGVSFERRAVSGGGSGEMLFRAVELEVEDSSYREYLNALLRWRETGYQDYTFVVRSSQGMVSYEARYTVVGGEVTAMEKISSFPEFIDPPAELKIENLFAWVGSAIEQDAAKAKQAVKSSDTRAPKLRPLTPR